MSTFRNVAAVLVAWMVFGFLGNLLLYVSQFVLPFTANADVPGSIVFLELISALPLFVVAVLSSWLVALSVRPKAARVWAVVFSALVLVSYGISSPIVRNPMDFEIEFALGKLAAASLLAGGVFLGFHFVRRGLVTAA